MLYFISWKDSYFSPATSFPYSWLIMTCEAEENKASSRYLLNLKHQRLSLAGNAETDSAKAESCMFTEFDQMMPKENCFLL